MTLKKEETDENKRVPQYFINFPYFYCSIALMIKYWCAPLSSHVLHMCLHSVVFTYAPFYPAPPCHIQASSTIFFKIVSSENPVSNMLLFRTSMTKHAGLYFCINLTTHLDKGVSSINSPKKAIVVCYL